MFKPKGRRMHQNTHFEKRAYDRLRPMGTLSSYPAVLELHKKILYTTMFVQVYLIGFLFRSAAGWYLRSVLWRRGRY